jgi:hypothetical protein
MMYAIAEKMNNAELIRYFARMMFNQPPEDPKAMFDLFLNELIPQPPNGQSEEQSKEIRKKQLIRRLEYSFRQFGTDCK